MQVKNIEEYNPENYGCYAVTSVKDDFLLYTIHPEGLLEYINYDVYSIGSKFLLAFKEYNTKKTDYVYRIVSETETEEIDFQTYEILKDIIDGSYDTDKNVFILMNSVSIPALLSSNTYYGVLSADERCDTETFGPVGFRDLSDGSGLPVVDIPLYVNSETVSSTCCVNSMGNIHILRTTFKKDLPDAAFRNRAGVTGNARTLSLALKMAYDWAQSSKDPWNNQSTIAINCSNFIDNINISNEVIEELKQLQIPGPVELYLSGHSNPREYKEEILEMPPLFKKWFLSRIRYESLGSLANAYPEALDIDPEMIKKETDFFDETIEYYCLINELDVTSITMEEIINHVQNIFADNNLTRNSELFNFNKINSLVNIIKKKSIQNNL